MFNNIFRNKTVLVTGHTGFKGSWLCIWLKELGANVIGFALEPYTPRDNFVVSGLERRIASIFGDVRDFEKLRTAFEINRPEFVFHLAAQATVRRSYSQPKETYDTNIVGTINVLESCRLSDSVKTVVNVTSDKCYENREWDWGYRENDSLGGYDPYSSSKACAELITDTYRNCFFGSSARQRLNSSGSEPLVALSSVRAGNVIGGGDWQNDRIIPDCIKALEANRPIEVRNPLATRPWQHVLEPLCGYLLLASKMYCSPATFSGAWNFGPDDRAAVQVGEITEMIVAHWGAGTWVDISGNGEAHEANRLSLDISKARTHLDWQPRWGVDKAVEKTVCWYRNYKQQNPYRLCVDQIKEYSATAGGEKGSRP